MSEFDPMPNATRRELGMQERDPQEPPRKRDAIDWIVSYVWFFYIVGLVSVAVVKILND